jgi:hypothetical protein
MAILVAPVVAQLRVLLAPEVMAVGSAVKEAIVGAEAFPGEEAPGDEADEPPPQSARPKQANRMRTSGQSSGPQELQARGLSSLLESQLWESMRKFSLLSATLQSPQALPLSSYRQLIVLE